MKSIRKRRSQFQARPSLNSSSKIDWNQEAVAVQNPYTPAQIVSMAYTSTKKCGLYQDDCQEWSCKLILKKTWRNLKSHFARAFKETRRSYMTSKTKGYVANVQSTQVNTALFTEMHQDHTMALANLSEATQANRTAVALLTKTTTELSTQTTTFTAKLVTAQSKRPQPSTDIVRPIIRPHLIKICSGTSMSIQGAGKESNPTCIDNLTGLR